MDLILQQQLRDRHPKMLSYPAGSVIVERGIETLDGWFELIDVTLTQIELNCGASRTLLPTVRQIKEKLGKLRIYVYPSTDAIDAIRLSAEERSATICESCGKDGRLVTTRGHIHVACDACQQNRLR
jgi:hypothetical protein